MKNINNIQKLFLIFLFISTFILINFEAAIASEPVYNQQIKKIMKRQQEIKNFQTDANLEIKIFSGQKSTFNFQYFYHEPDLVHLETNDFVLLPTEPLKSLEPSFLKLENYNINCLNKKDKNSLKIYELHPIKKKESNYYIKIWIDISKNQIEKAVIFFHIPAYEKEFSLNVNYKEISGYSMPITIQGNIAIPAKFGMKGKIKEFNRGYFDLKLKNYKINQGFSPNIMKKLKN